VKRWFSLFLTLAAFGNAPAQQMQVDYPEVKLPDGRSLAHARVTSFDGETFLIEHRTGIAHVAWTNMPADWQSKFPHDPERASKNAALKLEKVQAQLSEQADRERLARLTLASQPNPPPASSITPETQLARPNRDNLPDDLKVGITTQHAARFLGRPRKIEGDEWFYPRFSLVMRDGKVAFIRPRARQVPTASDPR
jgi:hypothetical protein